MISFQWHLCTKHTATSMTISMGHICRLIADTTTRHTRAVAVHRDV